MLRDELRAEELFVLERLVLAPQQGVFHPFLLDAAPPMPEVVMVGQHIGAVLRTGEKYPVMSNVSGLLLGLLVLPGERVRRHQPVAWLRTTEATEPSVGWDRDDSS